MALIHFIERELVLEEEMFNRGKDRFFANIARLKEQRNEGGTTYGKMLLKRGIAPLAAAITAFMEKANSGTAGRRHMAVALLKDIAPDVAAFITLRTAIAPLTSEPMLQNVAVRVGREIEAELRLSNLKQNDADRYAMTQRYIQGHKSRKYRSTVLRYAYGKSTTVDFEPWPLAQCLHLGQKLIELAIDSTGIFAIELTSNKVRKGNKDMAAYSLVMTPALKEWMDDHLESRSIMAPAYMPTLIPPKPWEGACGGGYYFQAMRPLSVDPETGEEPDGSREHPFAFLYGMDVTKDSYYSYEGKLWLARADMPACVWVPGTAGLWQWEEASAA